MKELFSLAKWREFLREPSPWWGLLLVPYVVLFALNGWWPIALGALAAAVMIGSFGACSVALNRWNEALNARSELLDAHASTLGERRENLNQLSDSLAEWDRQLTERERNLDARMGRARHVN